MSFCLRKVTHFWGYKEGNYVYYMVAPPWVRSLVNDVINMSKNMSQGESSRQKASINSGGDTAQAAALTFAEARMQVKKPALFSRDIVIS